MPNEKWRLSHSQVSTLSTCGHQHYLEKRVKVRGRPHWSTIGGSAFHKMAEMELLTAHGLEGAFVPEVEDALQQAIDETLLDSPYSESEIRTSKTLPKGWSKTNYPNGADRSFLTDAIPVWLQQWRSWMNSIPYHLWFDEDGEPGTEVELRGELGGHPVVAYIDGVLEHNETGDLLLVDWKAGARHIAGTQQLGTYRVLFEGQVNLPAKRGAFYYAREGQSAIHDLQHWTKERLDVIYANAGAVIEQGLYLPNFDSCEYMCSVSDYCGYVGGKWADQAPMPVFLGLPGGRPDGVVQ